MKIYIKFIFALCFFFSNSKKEKSLPLTPTMSDAPFEIGKSVGMIDSPEIMEASGLVASRNNSHALWVHNDSGDKNRIFLISESGKLLATFTIDSAKHRDWEDITIGEENGINYLYVGDIGDNFARNEVNTIYRFPEPQISPQDSPIDSTIKEVKTIQFRYPDGKRDAECLMFDPATKDLIIISKREDNVGIYLAPYPQSFTEIITLQKVGELPFNQITAGDISPNGKEILIKNYLKVYYWKKEGQESMIELLRKPYLNLPYQREVQGEAIAWKIDGSGYFTLSENPLKQPLHLFFYQRK
ncbi:hypothetical protein SAMN04488541_101387 [Thermoflexibacter ruber]|uniref:WD40-like Beta Propeller Repeat n=2 Tax=Thermoflexibacter ruber TaxID=1003 RepID=A0A1I2FGI1_9BACT|nr:hypothetical protein SAMN04488541_101387 [Thermoflexibacter ruber]